MITKGTETLNAFSNIALLVPVYYAHTKGKSDIRNTLIFESVVSALYHLCKGLSLCIVSYQTLHNLDFFFATSLIWLICAAMIRFHYDLRNEERLFNMAGQVAVAIMLILFPHESLAFIVFSGVSIGILISYFFLYFLRHCHEFYIEYKNAYEQPIRKDDWVYKASQSASQWRPSFISEKYYVFPKYNWWYISVGVQLMVLASSLYISQDYWASYYWAIHSLWHILGPIGFCFILLARESQGKEWEEDRNSK